MAMSKIDRIDREIEKTRGKITEYQNRLKELEAQRTEQENFEIVNLVRSMCMSRDELPPETWQEEPQPEDTTIVPGTPFTEDGIAATRDLL